MRRGRRNAQADEAEVDMTPMLDIVFIMLIFFIVTATFLDERGVDLTQPPRPRPISRRQIILRLRYMLILAINVLLMEKARPVTGLPCVWNDYWLISQGRVSFCAWMRGPAMNC